MGPCLFLSLRKFPLIDGIVDYQRFRIWGASFRIYVVNSRFAATFALMRRDVDIVINPIVQWVNVNCHTCRLTGG